MVLFIKPYGPSGTLRADVDDVATSADEAIAAAWSMVADGETIRGSWGTGEPTSANRIVLVSFHPQAVQYIYAEEVR